MKFPFTAKFFTVILMFATIIQAHASLPEIVAPGRASSGSVSSSAHLSWTKDQLGPVCYDEAGVAISDLAAARTRCGELRDETDAAKAARLRPQGGVMKANWFDRQFDSAARVFDGCHDEASFNASRSMNSESSFGETSSFEDCVDRVNACNSQIGRSVFVRALVRPLGRNRYLCKAFRSPANSHPRNVRRFNENIVSDEED